jgi:environmental stress-induced protein Ves
MRLLPQSAYRRMQWKNGGGETIEIAVEPPGASLDTFDWRVSMAKVGASGPFSAFPGVERTLCVLSEGEISLAFAGRGEAKLDAASPPYSFPADLAVDGKLTGGGITDLNVMTRRGCCRHHVSRMQLVSATNIAPLWDRLLIFAFGSEFSVDCGGDVQSVAAGDSILIEPTDGPAHLTPTAPGTIFIIDISGR